MLVGLMYSIFKRVTAKSIEVYFQDTAHPAMEFLADGLGEKIFRYVVRLAKHRRHDRKVRGKS